MATSDPVEDSDSFVTSPTRKSRTYDKHQTPDAVGGLDRLGELQEFYQSTFKRPLPLRVKGQGSIHNKLGYDHRDSADIALDPRTPEGTQLAAFMRERNMPFLAFDRAIPGVATGPHIHYGRPSHSIANKYPVGTQVRKTKQVQGSDPVADSDSFVGSDDPVEASDAFVTVDTKAPARKTPTAGPAGMGVDIAVKLPGRGPAPADAIRHLTGMTSTATSADEIVTPIRQVGTAVRNLSERPLSASEARRRDDAEIKLMRQTADEVKAAGGAPQNSDPYAIIPDNPNAEHQAVMRRVAEKIRRHGTAIEALNADSAAAQAEQARQDRIASMTPAARLGARSLEFATGPARGLVGTVGTTLKGVAALNQVLPFSLTAIPGQVVGSDGSTTDDPYYQLGDVIAKASRGGLLNPRPDFETEFIAGQAPEVIGQSAVFMLGGWASSAPRLAVAVLGTAMTAGDTYDEVRTAGGDDTDATIAALVAGTLLGPTELIGLRGAMKAVAGTAREATIRAALHKAYVEGRRDVVENLLQEIGQEFGQGLITGQHRTGEQLARAGALGAVGGTVTAPLTAIGALPSPVEAAERALQLPPSLQTNQPTVSDDLQARLSRQEVTGAQQTPSSPAVPPPVPLTTAQPPTPTGAAPQEQSTASPSSVVAPPLSPERMIERAREDREMAEERRQSGETGPREQVYTDEQRLAAMEALGAPPIELHQIPKRSLADVMADRAANVPETEPSVTEPVTETTSLSPTAREAAASFHDLANASGDEILSTYGFGKGEDPEALRDNHLMNKLEDFARATGMPFNTDEDLQAVNNRVLDMKPDDYAAPATLPADLRGAKPRYSIGTRQFDLTFASDFDRAAYITAQTKRSKRDADYMAWAVAQSGLSPAAIRAHGMRVRAAIKSQAQSAGDTDNLTIPAMRNRSGEAGYIDIGELRDGIVAGTVKLSDAIDRLAAQFPNASHDQLRTMLAGDEPGKFDDVPFLDFELNDRVLMPEIELGDVELPRAQSGTTADPAADFARQRAQELLMKLHGGVVEVGQPLQHTRPDIAGKPVIAIDTAGRAIVANPDNAGGISRVKPSEPSPDEMIAGNKPLIRQAGREYKRDYAALHDHPARRDGLDVVNDDVAANYLSQLRRFTATHKPDATPSLDRAEQLYAQGRFRDATLLTEQALSGTHDYPSKLGGALLAKSPTTDYGKVMKEVRRRLGITLEKSGPFNIGGSIVYDVNKYPEGGKPDHAKIAYIIEPVIDAIRQDAAQLLAAGKLKAADYVSHIRSQIDKLLGGPEFTDWHSLNRAAARAVLVDQLRQEGPPPVTPSDTATAEEAGPVRKRSLPGTLERSGRDPGTEPTYQAVANKVTVEKVRQRIARDGAQAVDQWLTSLSDSGNLEEEAQRTEAFRQVSDAYQVESVRLQDSDPERAEQLRLLATATTNRELFRSTGLGQGIQAYTLLKKYEPASALLEAQRLADRAGVPLTADDRREVTESAVQYQQAAKELRRQEDRVAALQPAGNVGAGGTGTEQGGGTARRRRRAPTLLATPLEEATEARDAAGKRARAAKVRVARKLKSLEQQPGVVRHYRNAINFTRAMMVSAVSTAMRNLQSQVVRFDVERLDDLVEHSLRRLVGMDSDFTTRNIWKNTLRQFDIVHSDTLHTINSEREARDILSTYPDLLDQLYNTYSGDVTVQSRIAEIANFANRAQEFHLRSVEFLAEVDLHLRKDHNQSLEQFVQRNGIDKIPESIIRKGVDKALEVTFAASPSRDTLGGRVAATLIELGNWFPPTLSPVPFPRFMYNNLKFLYQHNITGLNEVARSVVKNRKIDARVTALRSDTTLTDRQRNSQIQKALSSKENTVRALARTLTGTSMMLLGLGLRESDYARDKDGNLMKWYEVRLPGGAVVDTRPFGPFSTYLFFGEVTRRVLHGEKLFTPTELAEVLGVSTGPGGSAIAIADKLYRNLDDWRTGDDSAYAKAVRLVKTEAGEWGRALLTPVRQFRDLVAAFDEQEGYTRDTSERPFTGPILESLPFASRAAGMQPVTRPTSAAPIHQEHPAVKALTGWRVESPKSYLEAQLTELNFTPSEVRSSTGHPRVDAIEKRLMGPAMDRLSSQLAGDSAFKSLPRAQRALVLRDMLSDVRDEVREQGQATDPDAYEELKQMKRPRREKDADRERKQSEGVSRALQLGVPLPTPQKRSGEDDLAYRTRLLQLSRNRAAALDRVVHDRSFASAPRATQRKQLYSAAQSV